MNKLNHTSYSNGLRLRLRFSFFSFSSFFLSLHISIKDLSGNIFILELELDI